MYLTAPAGGQRLAVGAEAGAHPETGRGDHRLAHRAGCNVDEMNAGLRHLIGRRVTFCFLEKDLRDHGEPAAVRTEARYAHDRRFVAEADRLDQPPFWHVK